jgi:hypothetical protein
VQETRSPDFILARFSGNSKKNLIFPSGIVRAGKKKELGNTINNSEGNI